MVDMGSSGMRKGSIRSVGTHAIRHGDSNSKIHARDVAEQKNRRRTEFVPVEIPEQEIEQGFCEAPTREFAAGGWMGTFGTPEASDSAGVTHLAPPPFARSADSKSVTDYLESINATRRQIRRQVQRNGKWRTETQRIHRVRTNRRDERGALILDASGRPETREADPVCAITVDMPPWVSSVFRRRLSNSEIDAVYEDFFNRAAREINTACKLQALAATRHPDTAIEHCDLFFSAVLADRTYTKSENWPSTGRWACRTDRLDRWGFELYGQKVDWLNNAMERQNNGLDLRLFRMMDEVCNEHAKAYGLTREIENEVGKYRDWRKPKVSDHLLSKVLRYAGQYHAASGVKVLEDVWHQKALTLTATVAGASLAANVAISEVKKRMREQKAKEDEMHAFIDASNAMLSDPEMRPPKPPQIR